MSEKVQKRERNLKFLTEIYPDIDAKIIRKTYLKDSKLDLEKALDLLEEYKSN